MTALKAISTPAGVILLIAETRRCPGPDKCSDASHPPQQFTRHFLNTVKNYVPIHTLFAILILILQLSATGSEPDEENVLSVENDWFNASCPGVWLAVLGFVTAAITHQCSADYISDEGRRALFPCMIILLFLQSVACLGIILLCILAVHFLYPNDDRKAIVISLGVVSLLDFTASMVIAILSSARTCLCCSPLTTKEEFHIIVNYVARSAASGARLSVSASSDSGLRANSLDQETPPPSYDNMWLAGFTSRNVLIEASDESIDRAEENEDTAEIHATVAEV